MISSCVDIADLAADQAFATGHARCSICSRWVRAAASNVRHVCKRCGEEEQKYAELPSPWSPLRLF